MKNKVEISFSRLMFVSSIFIFSLLLSKTGFAQASYEVMCRNKAKEIAAETYKGCMTEQRQVQIEQIRKEYKEKLASLKSHYDKELKKMSSGTAATTNAANSNSVAPHASSDTNQMEVNLIKKSESNKAKQRTSGARLPAKKSNGVATQIIDLSAPVDSQINTPEDTSATESKAQPRIRSSDDNEVEIVDLQTQE